MRKERIYLTSGLTVVPPGCLYYQVISHFSIVFENKNEPTREILALFVLYRLILQMRMRSNPARLDV